MLCCGPSEDGSAGDATRTDTTGRPVCGSCTGRAAAHGGILARCDAAARRPLSKPHDVGILHGDLHHDNVLDFGDRGWLAIDPKGLIGERGFNYANIFCNPDLSDATLPVATQPDIFTARLALVAEAVNIERGRLLLWILAWAGLSVAWIMNGGGSPETSLRITEMAAALFAESSQRS